MEIAKQTAAPTVFVCHASEDKAVAIVLRDQLARNGIQTFIDTDDIRADASFVERINEGLVTCTHFLAVLSPIAVQKKWPRHEVHSITPRVVDGVVSFLPIALSGYTHADFRRDFATLAHIAIRTDVDIGALAVQLVNDILGVSRKPALGQVPAIATKPASHRLSRAAYALAQWFSDNSDRGLVHDPIKSSAELAEILGLTKEDLEDAQDDLRPYLKPLGSNIYPIGEFFTRFDPIFRGWDPPTDAIKIAAALQSDGEQECEALAKSLGFPPRRMNPAVMHLVSLGIVIESKQGLRDGYQPFIFAPGERARAKLRRLLRGSTA